MVKPVSSRTTAFIIAGVVLLGVFAAGCVSDVLFLRHKHNAWLALLDDLLVAAFAAGLVLYYEWRRDVELRRKLSTVIEMNHCVRNQLEIIEYSAWTTHNQPHMTQMHEAVSRIGWALREILGKGCGGVSTLAPAKPPQSVIAAVNPGTMRAAEIRQTQSS
jgi:hypothetical protein